MNEFNRILDVANAMLSVREPQAGTGPRPSKVPKRFNAESFMLTDTLPKRQDETEVACMRSSFMEPLMQSLSVLQTDCHYSRRFTSYQPYPPTS